LGTLIRGDVSRGCGGPTFLPRVLALSPDLQQVRGGGGELGFGLDGGQPSSAELAQPVPVFQVAVDGFDGDAAAPVGRHPFGGGKADAHLLDQLRLVGGRSALAGGGLQLAAIAGLDQPVRALDGQVVLGQVAGIGEQQPDRLGWAAGPGPARFNTCAAVRAAVIIGSNWCMSMVALVTLTAKMIWSSLTASWVL
jgi:hypothetical protein